MKKRWMNSVIKAAEAETAPLPWARGSRRASWKAAARARARAA